MLNNKILIIDDEQAVIDSIRDSLKREEYEILSANNGKDGIKIYREMNPILMILDLRMPVMGGLELLEQLKLSTSDNCFVIVLTGHGDDDEMEKCFSFGISAFLRKPFNVFELIGMVKHCIALKYTQMELMDEIVEHKRANKKAEHLASFPQLSINPILEVDSSGIITFYNNAAINALKTQGMNKNVDLFLPKDINEILKNSGEKNKNQLIREVEIGGLIFSETIHFLPEFNVVRIYARDITEHRNAAQQLQKLSTAVEQSPSVVVITDTNGCIEYSNPKFSQITGYTLEEVQGKTHRILKSGELSNEVYKQLWDTIALGHEWHGEFHNMKKNGELYWELASISSIISPEGNITHFIKVAEDITKRKLAEEELHTSYKQLLHSEKLSAIGKLSASIAHEFNNPLAGIRNVIEAVAERYDNHDIDKDEKKLLNLALKECDRIAGLIHNLQDFSRPSSGLEAMVDIHDVINEVLMLCETKLKQRSILVKKYYGSNIPRIKGVPDQIKQVILNIIQNAEESIAENNGNITIKTECDDLSVLIHIVDTGDGISKQNIRSIFEPFFTTKPAVVGTGLGLSISYGIIKKHKGDITVESEPGKGTTFTIIIPVSG